MTSSQSGSNSNDLQSLRVKALAEFLYRNYREGFGESLWKQDVYTKMRWLEYAKLIDEAINAGDRSRLA